MKAYSSFVRIRTGEGFRARVNPVSRRARRASQVERARGARRRWNALAPVVSYSFVVYGLRRLDEMATYCITVHQSPKMTNSVAKSIRERFVLRSGTAAPPDGKRRQTEREPTAGALHRARWYLRCVFRLVVTIRFLRDSSARDFGSTRRAIRPNTTHVESRGKQEGTTLGVFTSVFPLARPSCAAR